MYYPFTEAVTILRGSSWEKMTGISNNATNGGRGGTFYYKEDKAPINYTLKWFTNPQNRFFFKQLTKELL